MSDLIYNDTYIDSDVKPSNALKKHIIYHSLVEEILKLVQSKIPEFIKLKVGNSIELELILLLCNIVENAISNGNKHKIDKKQLVCDVIQRLFNLNPVELKAVEAQIDYLHNNSMIKKISRIYKFGKWLYECCITSKKT